MVEAGGSIQGLSGPSEIGAKCMVMGAVPYRDDRKLRTQLYFYFASVRARWLSSEPMSKQANINISELILTMY